VDNSLPIADIIIKDRQRSELGDVKDLADSIQKNGLIQPVVVNKDRRLIAGGRRIEAAKLLGWVNIPVAYLETLSDGQIQVLELEENIRRKDLEWHEKCKAIARYHSTLAREATLSGKPWTLDSTADALGISQGNVTYNRLIAEELKDETSKIWKCTGFTDAIRFLVQRKQDEVQAELAKRTLNVPVLTVAPDIKNRAKEQYEQNPLNTQPFEEYWDEKQREDALTAKRVPLSTLYHLGNCLDWMGEYEPETIDHVITDPPYAIDMEFLSNKDLPRVEEEHDVAANQELLNAFIPAAFRVLRPSGFLVMWCDIMQWQLLYDAAIKVGFKVQRWPLVWVKTSVCSNQAAQYNFTKNFELAIVCRKEGAVLMAPSPGSTVIVPNTPTLGGNPFAKPPAVWEFIIRHVTLQGQLIMEPFAGVGSGVLTMLRAGRRVIGCEINPLHYNVLVESVESHYNSLL
jgi:ParB/RepB/Spo0J family partition protein